MKYTEDEVWAMIAESREACKRLWKLGSRSTIGGGEDVTNLSPF